MLRKVDEKLLACFLSSRKKKSMLLSQFEASAKEFIPELSEALILNCPFLEIKGRFILLSEEGERNKDQVYRKHYVLNRFARNLLNLNEHDSFIFDLNMIGIVDEYLLERFCVLIGHVSSGGPKGECCLIAEQTDFEKVIPLYKLPINNNAVIIYLSNENSPVPARLINLGVYPGAKIKLKQIFPAYVLELKDNIVAIESQLAKCIYVKLVK